MKPATLPVLKKTKKLTWDAKNMKATNAPEADQYIRPKYREGWKLDG